MKFLHVPAMAAVLSLALAPAAFAKGKGGSPQTHHCVKDGATVEKTRKACVKDGGTWAKNDGPTTSTTVDKTGGAPK